MDILAAATGGYFDCRESRCKDTLSMATSGLLTCYQIEIPTIEDTVSGGGKGYGRTFKYSDSHEVLLSTRRQLIREDQEILLIIKNFTHIQE